MNMEELCLTRKNQNPWSARQVPGLACIAPELHISLTGIPRNFAEECTVGVEKSKTITA